MTARPRTAGNLCGTTHDAGALVLLQDDHIRRAELERVGVGRALSGNEERPGAHARAWPRGCRPEHGRGDQSRACGVRRPDTRGRGKLEALVVEARRRVCGGPRGERRGGPQHGPERHGTWSAMPGNSRIGAVPTRDTHAAAARNALIASAASPRSVCSGQRARGRGASHPWLHSSTCAEQKPRLPPPSATHSRTPSRSQRMAMSATALRAVLRRAGLARHVARMRPGSAAVLLRAAAPRAGFATAAPEPEAVSVTMETSPNMNSRIFNVSGVRVLPAHVTAGMVSCTGAAGEGGSMPGAASRVLQLGGRKRRAPERRPLQLATPSRLRPLASTPKPSVAQCNGVMRF